jgi:hypothetical protein
MADKKDYTPSWSDYYLTDEIDKETDKAYCGTVELDDGSGVLAEFPGTWVPKSQLKAPDENGRRRLTNWIAQQKEESGDIHKKRQ